MLETPGQLRLLNRELGGAFFLQVVIWMKPEEATPQVTTYQEIMALPMGWQQQKAAELDNEENQPFESRCVMERHAARQQRLLYYYRSAEGGDVLGPCFLFD